MIDVKELLQRRNFWNYMKSTQYHAYVDGVADDDCENTSNDDDDESNDKEKEEVHYTDDPRLITDLAQFTQQTWEITYN